jgi:arginase family enzyme
MKESDLHNKPVVLFGCSLDPDEREQSIQRKLRYASSGVGRNEYSDPYDVISKLIGLTGCAATFFKGIGKIDVETWLTPFPLPSDLRFMTVENFVKFIDSGGCYEYVTRVHSFTKEAILPNIPFLIGVDHSLTGGVLKALSENYGREKILAIFIDSHFDGISLPVRLDLIQYDIENNARTIFCKNDPYIYDRKDCYNTESFIKFLIKEQIILPENTICAGIVDYPSRNAFRLRDPRVRAYVQEFRIQEERGLTFVKKEDIRKDASVLERILRSRDIEYVYISIDTDIGANSVTEGVRFADGYMGMRIDEIRKMARDIARFALTKGALIGLDVMEIDMSSADESTYALALTILKELLTDFKHH